MSFATATPAQRRKVRDEATKAMFAAQPFAQNAVTPTAAESTAVGTVLAGLSTALADVGVTPALPATQVTLSSGQKVNAVSVTGTGNFATFTIVGGAITAIVLSAS